MEVKKSCTQVDSLFEGISLPTHRVLYDVRCSMMRTGTLVALLL